MDLTGARWRKSRYSGSNGGNCVEVATNLPEIVAVRDTKDPDDTILIFTSDDWDALLRGAHAGRFDLP